VSEMSIRPIIVSLVLAATSVPGTALFAEDAAAYSALKNVLIIAAAADFRAHGPQPDAFRDVQLRHLKGENEGGVYMLCGEFLKASDDRWIAFATIRTSSYEQWIGGTASGWCQQATPVEHGAKDLAPDLAARITSTARAASL
jgi:hypothetical protein